MNRRHGRHELIKYRAVQQFGLGRAKTVVPGDLLEFQDGDAQAQRLVDIGRIVPTLDEEKRPKVTAPKGLKKDIKDEVAEVLQARWGVILRHMKARKMPVDAFKFALLLEQKGQKRDRLMNQLETYITTNGGGEEVEDETETETTEA